MGQGHPGDFQFSQHSGDEEHAHGKGQETHLEGMATTHGHHEDELQSHQGEESKLGEELTYRAEEWEHRQVGEEHGDDEGPEDAFEGQEGAGHHLVEEVGIAGQVHPAIQHCHGFGEDLQGGRRPDRQGPHHPYQAEQKESLGVDALVRFKERLVIQAEHAEPFIGWIRTEKGRRWPASLLRVF